MSAADDTTRPASPDDALPPVEPPSAGFIVQLFVVPLVIVTIIVAVYLLFNQLAQMGTNPAKHISQIRKGGPASWQAAHDLATELRRNADLRGNEAVAAELSLLLQNELRAGSLEKEAVNLRVFLCKSLGEFDGLGGLPALLEAASAQADEAQAAPVRLSALESLALVASKLHPSGESAPLLPAAEAAAPLKSITDKLVEASHGESPQVQSTAAFALGVAGNDDALARLRAMLDSAHPDVRFNAATGLARWGDTACLAVLVEMLDPQEWAAATATEEIAARDFKQVQVVTNALRAARQLAAANAAADLSPLRAAAVALRDEQLLPPVKVELEQMLQQLNGRGGANKN